MKVKQKRKSFFTKMVGFRPRIALAAIILIAILVAFFTIRSEAATAWPLKVGPTGRYLVDQNGKAFLYTADTGWSLLHSLSVSSAKKYIDIRKEQGFNVIMSSIAGFDRRKVGPHGSAFEGDDLTKPNEQYFAAVDEILQYAQSKDMVIMMGPLWMADNGGRVGGRLPSDDEFRSYAAYLGNRYKNTGNIVWFVGGDDDPNRNIDKIKILGNALNQADPNHLITYHTWNKGLNVKDEGWLDFNSFQWNANTPPYSYQDISEIYNTTPIKPVFDMEPSYEPTPCCGDDPQTSLQENRRSGWWAILSGSMGVAYGGPSTTWNAQEPLNEGSVRREGAYHTGNIYKILSLYPWEKLLPDNDNRVVTQGRGNRGGNDYVTAAKSQDGSLIVAYTPSSRTLTVNMSTLAGPARGYWIDPTNGNQKEIGTNLPNNGSQSFTTPGNNAGGDSDFVLIISTSSPIPPTTLPDNQPPSTMPTEAVIPTEPFITPTIYCLSSESCITPDPTDVINQPDTTIYPPNNPSPDKDQNNNNNNKTPNNRGFFAMIFAFFAMLLQLFATLFRGN